MATYRQKLRSNLHAVRHTAVFGVVFLLFSIGLELSYSRLRAMAKYVFGLGIAQLVLTTALASAVLMRLGLSGSAATVVGVGLAFSSTAVGMEVLQGRNEAASRHGRATFAVLLMQDLAVREI